MSFHISHRREAFDVIESIAIYNYLLIKDVQVTLKPGLTVFTGETGAGKSLLIDAIQFLSRKKVDLDMIGSNDNKCSVTLRLSEDLTLMREVFSDGRSSFSMNGKIVSHALFASKINQSIDIHAQNNHLELLKKGYYLDLLDQYACIDRSEYIQLYKDTLANKMAVKKLKDLKDKHEDLTYLESKYEEYQNLQASLSDYEDITHAIKEQESSLHNHSNFEKMDALLYSKPAVIDTLFDVKQLALRVDENLGKRFESSYIELEDVIETYKELKETQSFDQERFDEYQKRISLYHKYIRQFGSLNLFLKEIHQVASDLETLSKLDTLLVEKEEAYTDSYNALKACSDDLYTLRVSAAKSLQSEVLMGLRALKLVHSSFDVEFHLKPFSAKSNLDIDFKVSFNKGLEQSSLGQCASGGELSRFMLVLKAIMVGKKHVGVLILDEIDTGLSGSVAVALAQMIKAMSQKTQVIAITHLPSVASYADSHYKIYKEVLEYDSITHIELLSKEGIIDELSMMMLGEITNNSRLMSEYMYQEGRE